MPLTSVHSEALGNQDLPVKPRQQQLIGLIVDFSDRPATAAGGSEGEDHHPPAAPRHETRLADDAADAQPLTFEQLAAQAWVPQVPPQ